MFVWCIIIHYYFILFVYYGKNIYVIPRQLWNPKNELIIIRYTIYITYIVVSTRSQLKSQRRKRSMTLLAVSGVAGAGGLPPHPLLYARGRAKRSTASFRFDLIRGGDWVAGCHAIGCAVFSGICCELERKRRRHWYYAFRARTATGAKLHGLAQVSDDTLNFNTFGRQRRLSAHTRALWNAHVPIIVFRGIHQMSECRRRRLLMILLYNYVIRVAQ